MNTYLRWIALTAALLVLAAGPTTASVVANSDPCGDVQYSPGPPPDEPDPAMSGTVIDAGTQNGIGGATMKVYQCEDGEATYIETVYTGQSGDYFTSTLSPEYFYYVEAVITGPLSGMTPAAGTENPSDAVGLGYSVDDLDFEFED